jgi:hypothetical protein
MCSQEKPGVLIEVYILFFSSFSDFVPNKKPQLCLVDSNNKL